MQGRGRVTLLGLFFSTTPSRSASTSRESPGGQTPLSARDRGGWVYARVPPDLAKLSPAQRDAASREPPYSPMPVRKTPA